MNRAMFVEKLTKVQQTMGQLLTQLRASEHDHVVAHLLPSPKAVPAGLRGPEQGQQGDRAQCPFNVQGGAQSLGFNRDFRAWEHLLWIGD